jgi:hypothetical protein
MKKCKRTMRPFKKDDIAPNLGGNQGSALSEKGKSLNSNNSNDECNSSDADLKASTKSGTFTLHCHHVEVYLKVCPSNVH